MEVKFNSLFDNDVTQNEINYYHVDTVDTTLLLSNLVLGEDTGKSEAIQKLGERNFGNYPNYLLSGRPCATRGCPPEKFCDSSGWPESPVFKPSNPCEMPFSPNSQRGDPNLWARNIELENKLRKIDILESTCHLKMHKADPCAENPEACPMACHKNVVASDYMLPNDPSKKWDINVGTKMKYRTITENVERAKKINKRNCDLLVKKAQQNTKPFITYRPTKRRDVLNW